jgi:hypothetical protein
MTRLPEPEPETATNTPLPYATEFQKLSAALTLLVQPTPFDINCPGSSRFPLERRDSVDAPDDDAKVKTGEVSPVVPTRVNFEDGVEDPTPTLPLERTVRKD